MKGEPALDPRIVEQVRGTPRLSDVAYEAIREAIATGRIPAGERLRQEALAQELGVSQVTVREALSKLAAEGLAISEPYRGMRVTELSLADLLDIYDMRSLIEGLAWELAAGHLSEADLTRMRELLPRTVAQNGSVSAQEACQANREFHWIVIRSSKRNYLQRTLAQFWDLTVTYQMLIHQQEQGDRGLARKNLAYHTELLEALEAGEGTRARQLAAEHIRHAGRNAVALGDGNMGLAH